MEKIIAIVGPTSSGKTDLSIRLAKIFKGEIISADSRQVYKGFNLCSGKITGREMAGIRHYLLDVASPGRTYTVARFKKDARQAIEKILKHNRLPIVVGGTGLYIDALINNQSIPEVPPNPKLRKQLESKPIAELAKILKSKGPERAKTIDLNNPRRLIRAIEIIYSLGKVPEQSQSPAYDALYIGLHPDENSLRQRIKTRLRRRINNGMINEIKKLHDKHGLSWKRLESFGLELKYVSQYLRGKITKEQMINSLGVAIWRYAKRQMTWFKRNKNIHWVATYNQAKKLVKAFI